MRSEVARFLLVVLLATGLSTLSSAQQASQSQPPKPTPGAPAKLPDDNPFPEDVSRKAADAAKQKDVTKPDASTKAGPPAAGESSSSTGYKPLPEDDDARPAPNPNRRKLSLNDPGAVGTPHADHIALKDEEIADLYFKDKNYVGALHRYQHALQFVPDDETAAFGVAESARLLGKREEAIRAYNTYLRLAPQGKRAKQARKAVGELSASGRHE